MHAVILYCSSVDCFRCLEKRSYGFSLLELHQCCPLCRGICTCRACLRENKYQPPEVPPAEQQGCATYVLQILGPHLEQQLREEEEEVRQGWLAVVQD